MRFFFDTEFLEDGERIYPISIGMVTDEGREFYRVYADWLCKGQVLAKVRDHRFLMTNVVPRLPDLAQQIVYGREPMPRSVDQFDAHPLVLPRWRMALELEQFVSAHGEGREQHELWAYYGAYDHVALSQTFGTMLQLPASVPMFTRELMQFEADVNAHRAHFGLAPVGRPVPLENEHNALADARWGRALYETVKAGDVAGRAQAWMIDEENDLVTVPSRVFVAGYERLMSVGPNEGLDHADEGPAKRLWDALL